MNWKLAKTISDLPNNVMPGKNRNACLLCSALEDDGRLVLADVLDTESGAMVFSDYGEINFPFLFVAVSPPSKDARARAALTTSKHD